MFWSSNVCRICAQISDLCIQIFDKNSTRDTNLKIKKCLALEVSEGDFKPKQICNTCLVKLNEFSEFLKNCYIANRKFESLLYQQEQNSIWDEKPHQVLPGVQEILIGDDNKNLEPFETHLDNYLDNDFEQKPKFNDFYQNQTVLRHSADYNKPFNDYTSSVKAQATEETEFSKGKSKLTIISIETIKPVEVLAGEEEKEKKVKPFSCSVCSKSFMRKLTLNAHMAIHTNVRPYVCATCNKSFAMQWDLTSHERVHTDLYRCQYCSKSFSVPSKLERHIRIHTGDRPFICPLKDCNRTFSDKRNLVAHSITHSDERKFVCEICKKCYKTNGQLRDHKRAHSNDTPFKCDICSKMYKWKTNLFLHLKKHNGYKCANCGKDCVKLSVLIKHRKNCKSRDN